jgi:hypothetical protein
MEVPIAVSRRAAVFERIHVNAKLSDRAICKNISARISNTSGAIL